MPTRKRVRGAIPDAKQICRLVTDLDHEVSTPLASIALTTEILSGSLEERTERQAQSLQNLIQATLEIRILVKRVVLLARLATRQVKLDPYAFQLSALVEEVGAAYPTVAISMVQPLPASFTIDRLRLLELIELMVEVGLGLDAAPELKVTSSRASGLSFVVKANGSMSKEQMARAFDPFKVGLRVARLGGQSGLELALLDHLNRTLDGLFEIASHPDGKVQLEIRFPLPPT